MALKQFTSKQLMDMTDIIDEKIENLENNFILINGNISNRLSVIQNIQEYESYKMTELEKLLENGTNDYRNKIVFSRAIANNLVIEGDYDIFGMTIHPQFTKTPVDVFNFQTVNGYVYKDNATISITPSGVSEPNEKTYYVGALYHDTISDQPICFEEFDDNTLKVVVTVSPGELLGSVGFNTIEIMPYLPGTFDITSLEIYSLQGYYIGSQISDSSFPNPVRNVGIGRFLIDSTIDLYRLEMTVRINWKNSRNKYPFGLKHLYFLNASYNPDSYIVVQVPQTKNIESISEDIIVYDQTGEVEAQCRTEGIELYYDFASGVGIDSISTSKGLTNNQLSRNAKTFYFKYPIYRSITALMFKEIKLRS